MQVDSNLNESYKQGVLDFVAEIEWLVANRVHANPRIQEARERENDWLLDWAERTRDKLLGIRSSLGEETHG